MAGIQGFQNLPGVNALPWTGGVRQTSPTPPPPPAIPGEQVILSGQDPHSVPQTAPSQPVTTRSGVTAEMRQNQMGVGIMATLPAGPLLPVNVIIQAVQTPQGKQARAFLDNKEKTEVVAGFTPDGCVAVTLDKDPKAPLLMFNPENLDYGLSSRVREENGWSGRSLIETIHADGSRSLNHGIQQRPDGTTSYNFVHQDTQGNLSGARVVQGPQGQHLENTPVPVSQNAEGMVTLQQSGAPPRSLLQAFKDSTKSMFTAKGWQDAREKSPFQAWREEVKAGGTRAVSFPTFSSTMAKMPSQVFPTLCDQAPPTPPPSAPPQAAPVQSSAPTQGAGSTAKVLEGDITQIPCDGLVTTINSFKDWNGGVDRAIYGAAQGQYHSKPWNMELQDGQAILARKTEDHGGKFRDVLFMVDDLKKPLGYVVYQALTEADRAGLTSVNLPAMRTGAMAGRMESEDQAVSAMADAIKQFRQSGASTLKDIQVVVFKNPQLAQKYNEALK